LKGHDTRSSFRSEVSTLPQITQPFATELGLCLRISEHHLRRSQRSIQSAVGTLSAAAARITETEAVTRKSDALPRRRMKSMRREESPPPRPLRYTEGAMAEEAAKVDLAEPKHSEGRSLAIGLTSLFFILLQSACTAFVAISGLRLLIGVGALAAAAAGLKFLTGLHGAALRIPMETIAIAGSVVNLLAVRRVRRLRARPESQWRVKQPTKKQLRSESWQVGLAVATLLLVAAEWGFHIHLEGSI
jgi:hypothetical protein